MKKLLSRIGHFLCRNGIHSMEDTELLLASGGGAIFSAECTRCKKEGHIQYGY